MKRSQAIEIISNVLGCYDIHLISDLISKEILSELEKAGMLPPHCEIAERKLYEKFKGPGYYSDGNNWEPED